MIKRRKMRLNGEWQLDGRNQVYELKNAQNKILLETKKNIE